MSAKDIHRWMENMKIEEAGKFIPYLLKDARNSVNKIGKDLEKKLDRHLKEKERIKKLWHYENELIRIGVRRIAGIDEAGRGPLAGPVVAAAVILPQDLFIEGIDDSKKISEPKREALFDIIQEKALAVGIGIVENEVIDQINILNATKLAMKKAVADLKVQPEYLLIDAVKLADIHIKQYALVKGESKSISIAAASIIAKVTRDRIIRKYDELYPQYGFAKHKGYGTKEHYESIEKYGLTGIHRKSFLKKIVGEGRNAHGLSE